MSIEFRRRAQRVMWVASLPVLLVFIAEGCSSPAASGPKAPAQSGLSNAEKTALAEASEEKDAQRVWCEYLEALYQRAMASADDDSGKRPAAHADKPEAAWPSLGECLGARTMASPEMLRRTAKCSRAALEKFDGDPFTREYAAAVSQCGAQALDAVEASGPEVVPFVTAICGRMVSCGDVTFDACKDDLSKGIGPHLERAVGAMNKRGREALEVCLRGISCGDVGSQVVGCLQPIMDGLLWLPG